VRGTKLAAVALVTTLASAAAEPSRPDGHAHPFFELDGPARRALVEKALSLERGDSRQSVIEKLGKPTYDAALARKEDQRPVGRTLKYYAVVWEAGVVNELHDQLVAVFLDEHDRVRSVEIHVLLDE